MDADTIADLKQFITVTISQQTADLREDISRIDKKIDDLSASVAEAIDTNNENIETQLKNHDKRITRLEHKIV